MEIRKLGRYEIEGILGQGAMGIVYKGRDPKIGRVVAIKTLRAGADLTEAQLEEFRQRFAREAQSAGRLTHPNIVTIYDVGEEEGTSYIAMEFLQGQSLEEIILKRQPLSIEQIIRLMLDLCSGLAYAHKNGIIHRDIKPANIILTDDGTAKITDFGIAKIVSTSATQTGMIVGTPSYMSPEQITGRPVDARSDLFSLGAVLYELLTFEKAFPGDNITTVMYRVVNENPTPVSVANMSVPTPFNEIVNKALQKNPNDRYPDAESFARDIQSIRMTTVPSGTVLVSHQDYAKTMVMNAESIPNLPTEPARPTESLRRKWRLIAGLGLFFILTVLIVLYFFRAPVTEQSQPGAGNASLELSLNIPEAQVFLDTVLYQLKDGSLKITGVRASEHDLLVRQEGYQEFRSRLVFSENEQKQLNVEMKLSPFRFPEGMDTAYLTIEAQPSGTRIETGTGQFVGFSPIFRHPFPAGRHTLVFSRPLYINLVRDVELKKKQELKLTPSLDYKKGWVSLEEITPTETKLFLSGIEYKPTTLKSPFYQLPLGEHRILLKKEGFKSLELTITVNDKDTTRLSGQLEPLYGTLIINSDPSGADVFIHGQLRGQTPLSLDSVPAGINEIRIQKSGMVSKKKITVRENTQNKVHFKLEAQTGTIRFLIHPWGNIFIGNKALGPSPPLEEHELPSGDYEIRIENPAFKTVKKKISVRAGENQTLRHEFK